MLNYRQTSRGTKSMYYKELCESIIKSDNGFFILDTETTGLHIGEICQIAIIDENEKAWFDTFVKTKEPIPSDATAIHGITDEMVKNAPTWQEIEPVLQNFLRGQLVVIYNAEYDRRMMCKSSEIWELPYYAWEKNSTFLCAMEAFAEFYGDWNDYYQSYRWQKLSVAANYCKFDVINAHNALADCQMTLKVVNHMVDEYQASLL